MDTVKLLSEIADIPLSSGREHHLTDYLGAYFKNGCQKIYTDSLNNLIIKVTDNDKASQKIGVFLPYDAVGLIVNYIEESGLVCVSPLGAISCKEMSGQVITNGKIKGVLVPLEKNAEAMDKFRGDFGFKDATDAQTHISVGDVLFFESGLVALNNCQYAGTALGVKGLVTAVMLAWERLKATHDKDIYLIFTAQSGLMGRGAFPATFGVKPDTALCLNTYDGNNFAVKVSDKALVCNEQLTGTLYECAKKHDENAVKSVFPEENSQDGIIQGAFTGVKIASLMMPIRCINSIAQKISLSTIEKTADIIGEFLNNI